MVKLNKTKIRWLIKQVIRENKRPSEIAPMYDLSVKRLAQKRDWHRTTVKHLHCILWKEKRLLMKQLNIIF